MRSLQGTDGHTATAGTVQTPEEDGEGQTAGAGERRREQREGGSICSCRQPCEAGGVGCPPAASCTAPPARLPGSLRPRRKGMVHIPEEGQELALGADGGSVSTLCCFVSAAGGRLKSSGLI